MTPSRYSIALIAACAFVVSCGGGGATSPGFSDAPNIAGMQLLTEQNFDCIKSDTCPTDWFFAPGVTGAFSAVSDAGAPQSPSGVLQQNFILGLESGVSPGAIGRDFPDASKKRTIYASMWMKLSSDFVGHQSNINKCVFFVINNYNHVYTMVQGTGSGPMRAAIGLQNLPAAYTVNADGETITGTAVNLVPNVANVPVIRGQWHRYEVLFVANTPGLKNGTAEMWLDGTKIMQYSGIMFVAGGQSGKWDAVNWGPVWGGAGGLNAQLFYAQMDHMVVRGR
ncbi:MAG TPA: hypothetical protein VJR92_09035 [Gemmatimonadaceae bacterium]|nr:hypothetical protein [Gemmatimonadaceae bacterium]